MEPIVIYDMDELMAFDMGALYTLQEQTDEHARELWNRVDQLNESIRALDGYRTIIGIAIERKMEDDHAPA